MSDQVNDPEAVLAKNEQLLSEKRALSAKLTALEAAAQAAGIPLDNPAAFLEQRESATRAARQRETAVKDAVMLHLIGAGRPVPPRVVTGMIAAAVADQAVTIDEKGSVSGAAEAVEEWLSGLKSTPPKPAPGLPDTRRPAERAAGPSTFPELVAQGPRAVLDFAAQNPEKYEALKRAHEQGFAAPRRSPTG